MSFDYKVIYRFLTNKDYPTVTFNPNSYELANNSLSHDLAYLNEYRSKSFKDNLEELRKMSDVSNFSEVYSSCPKDSDFDALFDNISKSIEDIQAKLSKMKSDIDIYSAAGCEVYKGGPLGFLVKYALPLSTTSIITTLGGYLLDGFTTFSSSTSSQDSYEETSGDDDKKKNTDKFDTSDKDDKSVGDVDSNKDDNNTDDVSEHTSGGSTGGGGGNNNSKHKYKHHSNSDDNDDDPNSSKKTEPEPEKKKEEDKKEEDKKEENQNEDSENDKKNDSETEQKTDEKQDTSTESTDTVEKLDSTPEQSGSVDVDNTDDIEVLGLDDGTEDDDSYTQHYGGGYSESDGYVSYEDEGYDVGLEEETVGETDISDIIDDSSTSIDDVIKGNKYTKLPTSSKPIQSSTSRGGSAVIPIAAGLSAAAAAGIGAKAYIDRKKNNDNGEEDIYTDSWSESDDDNLSLDDVSDSDKVYETDDSVLTDEDDYSYEVPETEKYDARSNDELADLQ